MNSWSVVRLDVLPGLVVDARARLVLRTVPTRRALVARRPLLLLRDDAALRLVFARAVARPRALLRAFVVRPRLVRLLLLRVLLLLLGIIPLCPVCYFNHGWP
jgi:hypothetical protein